MKAAGRRNVKDEHVHDFDGPPFIEGILRAADAGRFKGPT
jgi:hypothetical protein